MTTSPLQAIRGMNDLLPNDSPLWQYLERCVADVLHRYGYREIRFPLLEKTELFARGIGDVTDIVEKEMYTFTDKSGDSITLRPEGTASCVRACEQHRLLFDRAPLVQKLWYSGPMFRHERPQKGRLRQFHQFGAEAFGLPGPDIDTELLVMTARLWRELGVDGRVRLEINSLGTPESRANYRRALVDYLEARRDLLDPDSQARITRNPLRVLDSKVPETQALLKDAPSLLEMLDEESKAHFDTLRRNLDSLGIAYTVNPRLVRGLDYYGRTVFEWVTDALGAQGTVCAGGRYDGLVETLGGKATPGIGFAMGVERLLLLLEACDALPADLSRGADVYVVVAEGFTDKAMALCEYLRDALPYLRVQMHCGGGNFKNQMKKADKSGATYAVVLGEDEIAKGDVSLKFLREDTPQRRLTFSELIDAVS